jgi:hypothetical protein
MNPSESIENRARVIAKKRLGSEFGYFGGVEAIDYVSAIIEYLDKQQKERDKHEP